MCTLSFLPTNEGWIFTHNRDETVLRGLAEAPEFRDLCGVHALWPVDPKGGGTWWAATSKQTSLFLLNGAKVKHKRKAEYKHSRGLLIPAFLFHQGAEDFLSHYQFEDLEEFTLVGIDNNKLFEIIWDGKVPELNFLPLNEAKIWSSCTLYPPERQEQRRAWFTEFLASRPLNAEEAMHFHTQPKGVEPEFEIVMQRNSHLRTVAISQVECKDNQLSTTYKDLEKQTTSEYSFKTQNAL
jgi:hypothetical protein